MLHEKYRCIGMRRTRKGAHKANHFLVQFTSEGNDLIGEKDLSKSDRRMFG
jgi:hypothetical protein